MEILKPKIIFGNMDDFIHLINHKDYYYALGSDSGFLQIDLNGEFNERQWSKGREMPKETYGLYVVFHEPRRINFNEKYYYKSFNADDIDKVFAIKSNHWDGYYSYLFDKKNLKDTNSIPIRVDVQ